MKRLTMFLLAFRIERKWRKIKRNRQKMGKLLERKEQFTSLRLVRLDQETAKLGFSAKALENRYRELEKVS
ncbi:hypothetical protein V6615_10775 [Oscillospiraceae bacterium PP1C4]